MFVNPWKRRIIVNGFQYRLIAGNFLYLFSVVFAFFVVLFGPVVAVLADESVTIGQREVAAHQLLALHERVWFAIPVLVALCVFHSALVSHRIAGPLVRFKQVFARLADGDLSVDVCVRRHDYLREEADTMAEMVRGLGQRVESIQNDYRRVGATLPRLMDAVGRGAGEDAAVLAGRLGTELDALGEGIRRFRIPGDAVAAETESRQTPTGKIPTTA